jgi:hypothetical protein
MLGVPVCVLDITTPKGLADAAWLELADLEVVPVLVLHDGERELTRYVGEIPTPAQIRRAILARMC